MSGTDIDVRRRRINVDVGWGVIHDSDGHTLEVGDDLSISGGVLSLVKADHAEQDNTHPITSAAVYTEIGNIEALLNTI